MAGADRMQVEEVVRKVLLDEHADVALVIAQLRELDVVLRRLDRSLLSFQLLGIVNECLQLVGDLAERLQHRLLVTGGVRTQRIDRSLAFGTQRPSVE